jgi:hypothetical protein
MRKHVCIKTLSSTVVTKSLFKLTSSVHNTKKNNQGLLQTRRPAEAQMLENKEYERL